MAQKDPSSVADTLLSGLQIQMAVDQFLFEGAVAAMGVPLALFKGWYDFGAIRGLVRLMARLMIGYEFAAARNADSYMTRALSAIRGERIDYTGIRNTETTREGIEREEVFERIPAAYRFAQAEQEKVFDKGILLQSPETAAHERMKKIVGTNIQLAMRNQMHQTMRANGVTRWRRIIHPELSHEGTCGLCIVAADRIYHTDNLMAIHPGCHCTQLPIVNGFDPGLVLNQRDFQRIYSEAGSTHAEELRQTRFRIDQHGEIGPVIRPAAEPIADEHRVKKGRKLGDRNSPKSSADMQTTLRKKHDKLNDRLQRTKAKLAAGTAPPSSDWNTIIPMMEQRVASLAQQLEQ